jgi:glyoxylase-like metal-dependent hydrolase (beta-lactamase superfamily II)/ferredoxin
MADVKKAVLENVDGAFFVDSTCIDCDTCRQLAPDTFAEAGEYSYVQTQPQNEAQNREALHALLSCPTGSIGTRGTNSAKQAMDDFPLAVDEQVFYCGFNSPKSFGGSSYFIPHPDGNWLVDSPKFLPNLVKKLEAAGGLSHIFLTHSDDVGDVHRYAETFGVQRIIHREELWSQPDSEIVIDGTAAHPVHADFLVIPTPGHSRGHCALLYKNRYLFTGDHLWWDRDEQRLDTPNHYFWNKAEQIRSAEKLLAYAFEWILPGHGQRIHLPEAEMKAALQELISRKAYLVK